MLFDPRSLDHFAIRFSFDSKKDHETYRYYRHYLSKPDRCPGVLTRVSGYIADVLINSGAWLKKRTS
ncbi:MAG: hypothetical protein GY874_08180 [Desulfobacteraceae bacterium]|nr:hypothetical protein [Desulfobacteraceae bacterium]